MERFYFPDAEACIFKLPPQLKDHFGTSGFLYVPANYGAPPWYAFPNDPQWARCRRKALQAYDDRIDVQSLDEDSADWLGYYFPFDFPELWIPNHHDCDVIAQKFKSRGLKAPDVHTLREQLIEAIDAELLIFKRNKRQPWINQGLKPPSWKKPGNPALASSVKKASAPPGAKKAALPSTSSPKATLPSLLSTHALVAATPVPSPKPATPKAPAPKAVTSKTPALSMAAPNGPTPKAPASKPVTSKAPGLSTTVPNSPLPKATISKATSPKAITPKATTPKVPPLGAPTPKASLLQFEELADSKPTPLQAKPSAADDLLLIDFPSPLAGFAVLQPSTPAASAPSAPSGANIMCPLLPPPIPLATKPKPVPTLKLEPATTPEPKTKPEPALEPASALKLEPIFEPEPILEPEPTLEPEPKPKPKGKYSLAQSRHSHQNSTPEPSQPVQPQNPPLSVASSMSSPATAIVQKATAKGSKPVTVLTAW